MRDLICEGVEKNSAPDYIPTGLQEDIIFWTGKGKHDIILALHPNDIGKTTAGVNIYKNIIWQHDPIYFEYWDGYSRFRDKSYQLKKFRIASTPKNLVESAAIQTEIKTWWPKGRYKWTKGGQKFPSQCECDSGWTGDCFSYNQSREDFESIKLSIMWFDEPGRPDLVGACTSRFASDGMLWLITATPVNAGAFLDVIDDISDKGFSVKVKKLTGTADENSIADGKPNHLGTKRGLRTNEEIRKKKETCPRDEYDARILGKANYKSGRIYYDFDRFFHVRDYDLTTKYFQTANCFTVIDPHDKAYPFIQFWAWTSDNVFIQYNEWPTYQELSNNFYDEVRHSLVCNMNVEHFSHIIKIYEGGQYGLKVIDRWLDPRYGKSKEGTVTAPEGFVSQFKRYNLTFNIPPFQAIEVQRDRIRTLLKHDVHNSLETPNIVIMPHCVNSIRMLERHYWDEANDCETEQYKEGPDCMRILFAGLGNTRFKNIEAEKKKNKYTQESVNPIIQKMQEMAGIRM